MLPHHHLSWNLQSACLKQKKTIVAGEEHAMDEVSPDEPEELDHHSSSESEVLEDKYDDRYFHEELVGRKVTALYENGCMVHWYYCVKV